jgi:hypothetical protein
LINPRLQYLDTRQAAVEVAPVAAEPEQEVVVVVVVVVVVEEEELAAAFQCQKQEP